MKTIATVKLIIALTATLFLAATFLAAANAQLADVQQTTPNVAGGDAATRPDSRDAPHLFGAG